MTVCAQTLRGYRAALTYVGLGLFAFSLLICFSYQAIGGTVGVERLLELLPKGMQGLLRAQVGLSATPVGYIASGFRHPVYLVTVSAFAIAFSASALAGEIDSGTAGYLLARPVTRRMVVIAKSVALGVCLLVVLTFGLLGALFGAAVNGFFGEVSVWGLVKAQSNLLALGLLIGGVSMALSSRASERGQVIAQATGLFVTLFFLDYLTVVWPTVAFLGPISPFHYYDPVGVVSTTAFPWIHVAVLTGVLLSGFALAVFIFERRDITR